MPQSFSRLTAEPDWRDTLARILRDAAETPAERAFVRRLYFRATPMMMGEVEACEVVGEAAGAMLRPLARFDPNMEPGDYRSALWRFLRKVMTFAPIAPGETASVFGAWDADGRPVEPLHA